jgi:hypothetical protein
MEMYLNLGTMTPSSSSYKYKGRPIWNSGLAILLEKNREELIDD